MVNLCPYCKKIPDNPVTIASGLTFKPYDCTCCAQCFNIIRYDGNMKACKITDKEFNNLAKPMRDALIKAALFGKLIKGLAENL